MATQKADAIARWYVHVRMSMQRRGIRSGLCAADQTSLADLVEDADDNLFNSILYNNEHVLNRILPILKLNQLIILDLGVTIDH